VILIPLATLVYDDYMWTQSDTRVQAKTWIESNIPSGAKILIDGMRYRLVQSPPLKRNDVALARWLSRARETKNLSRGVSQQSLALYAEAAKQASGPKYDLHTTRWGLGVKALTYYIDACFNYIVTSSWNADQYTQMSFPGRFLNSVNFYRQLPTDPRFQVIYSIEAEPWQRWGPTITVYKVLETCSTVPSQIPDSNRLPGQR
jgi:hypothetical protein